MFFDDGRSEVDIDRGPSTRNTVEEYISATAYREIACINKYKIFPRSQGIFSGPGQYKPTVTAQALSTQQLSQSRKIPPPKRQEPSLFHTMARRFTHPDNIFVDPDNPTKIVGIIDWIRETLGQQMTGLSGSIFSDGEPLVQSKWMEVVGSDVMADVECPLVFIGEERKKIDADVALWKEGVELMDILREQVRAYAGWDGWVSHDDYEPVKERVRLCRERFLLEMAET
ncbi:hypothetical protein B7463_g8758, partial [Scytalidium lignicola]